MDNSSSYPLARAIIITAPHPEPEPIVGFRTNALRYNARTAAFSVGVEIRSPPAKYEGYPFWSSTVCAGML